MWLAVGLCALLPLYLWRSLMLIDTLAISFVKISWGFTVVVCNCARVTTPSA